MYVVIYAKQPLKGVHSERSCRCLTAECSSDVDYFLHDEANIYFFF